MYNGEYNIFGAFDKLDRYVHRWEHQGYKDRQDFRDVVIGFYVQFSALAQLSCQKAMDLAGEGTHAYNEAKVEKQTLIDDAKQIENMYKRCAVIQHPDLRIIRNNNGQDLYAYYRDVKVGYIQEYSDWDIRMEVTNAAYSTMKPLPAKTIAEDFDQMAFPNWCEIFTNQATAGELREIRQLYCKDTNYKTTLYDIFFSPSEGDFNNVGNLKRGTSFTGSRYKFYRYKDISNSYTRWEAAELLTDTEGKFDQPKTHRLLRVKNRSVIDHWTDEKYFSLVRYTRYISQGSLCLPSPTTNTEDRLISGMDASYTLPTNKAVTLSVQAKDGATYQWLVDKNDGNGLVNIEGGVASSYTLPSLDPSMNGWRYQCAITEGEVSDWGEGYTLTETVTLNLTGEGISAPATVHEVNDAEALTDALGKVDDGTWDGHTIKLMADIIYPAPITLLEHSITIDLNGHILTVQPSSDAEPNVNPMSNKAEIAAIYTFRSNLYINGNGALNVIAGQGIDYGVYVYANEVTVSNISSTDGGTAVYATDGGSVEITGDVSAKGENTYAVECFGGSTVKVSGNVNTEGHTSCGVYAESYNGEKALVEVGGDIVVSGANSQGAFLNADYTVLKVQGNITVTGAGASGISAGGGDGENRCTAIIFGDINAPMDAVNAWDNADVRVHGNVTATEEAATAVSVAGALVQLRGNVTSVAKDGTGISASEWDLVDPAVGAMVKTDGKITAYTPLRMKGMPVEEGEHIAESPYAGYYAFTDGTNTVWAKPGSFIEIADSGSNSDSDSDSDPAPNPQTGDSSNMVLWFMLGISASAVGVVLLTMQSKRKKVYRP